MDEFDWNNIDYTPAGSWDKRFFRGKGGRHTYDFVPRTEAQALLDEYSSNIGRNMKVKPFGKEQLEGAKRTIPGDSWDTLQSGGVFEPWRPDRVYLQKNASLDTLAHELAHAADPNVSQQAYDQHFREMQAGPPIADDDGDRVADDDGITPWRGDQRANDFRHYAKDALRSYESELLAEKVASDYARSRGFNYPDIGEYPAYYLDKYMNNWETSPAWREYVATTDPNNMEEIGFSRARPYQRAQQEYVEDLRNDHLFREAVGDFFNTAKTTYDRYKGTEF